MLLFLNIGVFALYLHKHCIPPYLSFFSQLTILGQMLIIVNFILALKHYHQHKFSKWHSKLFIVTFSIEVVATLGFWALRIFFTEGIISQNEVRDLYVEVLSVYVHGGSLLTLILIGRTGKIQLEFGFRKKVGLHILWSFTYIFIQWYHFNETGKHIYGFLELFDWSTLIAFESLLFLLSVLSDYFLNFAIEHR